MNKENTMSIDTAQTLPSSPPVFAAPIVEVEVVLDVVVGELELTLDGAINRLGEIQDEMRKLKKEQDALRKPTEGTLRDHDLVTYATPEGRSATTYERTTDQYPDRVYLAGLLTPAQMALAFPERVTKGMRIR